MPAKPTYEELLQQVRSLEKRIQSSESNAERIALLENTEDYIMISDEKGLPLLSNTAYARSMKEAHGLDMQPGIQPHKQLDDPQAAAHWGSLHSRALKGEKFRAEYSRQFSEGDVRHFEISFCPILQGGQIKGFSEITRDITARKQAELALQESEEKYREIVENINDAIFMIDETGTLLYISPVIAAVTGYTHAEIIGQNFTRFIYPDDVPMLLERIPELIRGIIKASEYRVVHKSGKIRWVRSSSRPVFNAEGLVGIRGILTDITESKEAQEEYL